MMKKELILTKNIRISDVERLRLEYYRLCRKRAEMQEYGVAIRCVGAHGEDYAEVLSVTSVPERIEEIAELLARATVTPVTLREVLEDIL